MLLLISVMYFSFQRLIILFGTLFFEYIFLSFLFWFCCGICNCTCVFFWGEHIRNWNLMKFGDLLANRVKNAIYVGLKAKRDEKRMISIAWKIIFGGNSFLWSRESVLWTKRKVYSRSNFLLLFDDNASNCFVKMKLWLSLLSGASPMKKGATLNSTLNFWLN